LKDKLGLLTANATRPYTMAFPNLEKTCPLVFEFPAGAIAGSILDFWQRPLRRELLRWPCAVGLISESSGPFAR
jgi:hypothetical protein